MKTYKLITIAAMLFMVHAASAQTISVADVDVSPGYPSTVIIKLDGAEKCIGAGFSVALPDGAFKENSRTSGYDSQLNGVIATKHVVRSNMVDDNTVKFAIYSLGNSTFANNSKGYFLNVDFNAYGMSPGTYRGRIKDIELALPNNRLQYLPDVTFNLIVDATGLPEIDAASVEDGEWYDVSGRRLPAAPVLPGVYILNGKKVVVK